MTLPALEGIITDILFQTCDALLGDTITITPPSSAPLTVKAHGNFEDKTRVFGVSAATVQDMLFDIDKATVPGKPGTGWRVTTAIHPGKLYEPREVGQDESGRRWLFGLKLIPGA